MAAAVGVALGMLGGGGSILMVSLLTYIGGLDAKQAIATSLLVVGTTSAIGAIGHARAGRVRWGVGLGFGLAGPYGRRRRHPRPLPYACFVSRCRWGAGDLGAARGTDSWPRRPDLHLKAIPPRVKLTYLRRRQTP
jgi:hypothetical protein